MKHSSQKHVFILGVGVSGSPRSVLLSNISQQLDTKLKSATIFTPNPEILLIAARDPEFRVILNSATFGVADGVGLALASGLTQQGSQPTIYPGRSLMVDLVTIAAQKELKVFFLGAGARTITKTLEKIKLEYPSVIAQGDPGPMFDVNGIPKTPSDKKIETKVISQINKFNPDILFVALGAPKQEKWIYNHKDELNTKLIMAVGGALDYFSGVKPLPPKWMQKWGLEWLWRVIKEPGHYKRAFNAVIIFPLTVLFARFKHD